MNFINRSHSRFRALLLLLCFVLFFYTTATPIYATQAQLNEEAEERKNDPVETNDVEGWPDGPLIGADSAILMDADTGVILYAKNIDGREFPASTTKIMTSLLAIENGDLSSIVTVNQSAIDANASDGSNMGLTAGEQLTLEEVLYGVLINSANEGCNAIGEHIAGSMSAYVDMMNARAAELGCTNTHFVTTNGLHDEEHYTSARDLALIAREFFSHDILCRMASTPTYRIEETATHKEHNLSSHNKLYVGGDYEYPYLVGSKTGFTSHSRQCLVSCAEKDGMRLICVIMREESPHQFEDTVNLFEYGFSNFTKVNVASLETKYNIGQASFFETGSTLYGSTASLLSIDSDATIILPKDFTMDQLETNISYGNSQGNQIGTIEYSYQSLYLGSVPIIVNQNAISQFAFAQGELEEAGESEPPVLIDIRKVLFVIGIIFLIGGVGFYVFFRMKNSKKKRRRHYRRVPAGRRSIGDPDRKSRRRIYTEDDVYESNTTIYEPADGKAMKPYRKTEMLSITQQKKMQKQKPRKINPIGAQIIRFFEYMSQFSEAQRVEDAKKERMEREEMRRQRLKEEMEHHRIVGQGSIRGKNQSQRRIFDDEEEYEYPDNVRSFDEGATRRKQSGNGKNRTTRNSSAGQRNRRQERYSPEEEEMLARMEQRRRLAEKRKRENQDN